MDFLNEPRAGITGAGFIINNYIREFKLMYILPLPF